MKRSLRAIAAAAAALITATGLVQAVGTTAAQADVVEDWNCVGPKECVSFGVQSVDGSGEVVPVEGAWDLQPISGSEQTDGLYRIVVRDTNSTIDHLSLRQCLSATDTLYRSGEGYVEEEPGVTRVEDCATADDGGLQASQWWSITPVGDGPDRVVDPDTWDPWTEAGDSFGDADRFYLTPYFGSGCITSWVDPGSRALDMMGSCDGPNAELMMYNHGGTVTPTVPPSKSAAQQADVAERLLGSAFARAVLGCQDAPSRCSAQLTDATNGHVLSEPSRIDELKITEQPTPLTRGVGCAGGAGDGGAQSIYNGGDEPMATTISASGTTEVSNSVTTGMTFENEFSFGKDSHFFSYSLKITTSIEYGRTWSESQSVSQDVSWTIPPGRYATATLSSSSILVSASWTFGIGSKYGWKTSDAVDLALPYATSANANTPDTTLSVHNSYGPKACDAVSSSVLGDGRTIDLENTSAPGQSPVVGDTLSALADADWFEPTANADATPATLRFQWYRVRSDSDPEKIPGARSRTYTVTGDDVTDPEVLDRFGPYHLLVGVTDVASTHRFDSREYRSVSTDGVRGERAGIDDTVLTLSVDNPGGPATDAVVVDVAASADGSPEPPSGTVRILDGSDEVGTVDLRADGTARTWLDLGVGSHALRAVYDGDGRVSGATSAVVRTQVRAAESITTHVAADQISVGDTATVRVRVTGVPSQPPTGSVRLFAGPSALGDPVALDADGTAVIEAPAADVAGGRRLWVRYLGDDVYARSDSAETSQAVLALPTTTTLSVGPPAVDVGDAVTLKARVEGENDDPVDGRVRFYDGDRLVAGPVALTDGLATARLDGESTVRVRRLRAEYGGTASYAGSTSAVVAQSVRPVAPRVRLRVSDPISGRGERVKIRVAVTAPTATGRVSGSVRVYADGAPVGPRLVLDPRGHARLRTRDLPVGRVSLSARFTPASGSAHRPAAAPIVRHRVRVHTSRVTTRPKARVVRKRDRVVLNGRVRADVRRVRGRVHLVLDGRTVRRAKVARDGTFRLRIPARRLDRGRTALRVQYTGSARPSVAPDRSGRIVIKRR